MGLNFQEVTRTIQDMESLGELRQLGEILQRRWKAVQAKACTEALKRIKVGSTVVFQSSGGVEVKGKVAKVNQKTVVVTSRSGQQWKVPLTMVTVMAK
jgi:preprotein translocase subunit YajC